MRGDKCFFTTKDTKDYTKCTKTMFRVFVSFVVKNKEDRMMRKVRWFLLGLVCAASAVSAALPEVSAEALAVLGSTPGIPQMNGFVFIDGKYIAPPYTVSRRGNGIFINRIQVQQPVPWVDVAQPEAPKKVLDADGDFEVVEPEETKVETKVKADDDELLFGGPGNREEKEGAHAIDALFDDPPAKKKEPEKKTAQPTSASLSKQQIDELKGKLDTLRKKYETELGRGDIYFFSERNSRVNGTYGTAKTLFAVLPNALRYAQSPQDLMTKLNQGGVGFLDLAACADLHKNRMTWMQLDERRKQIEADEAAKRPPAGGRTR